MDMRGRPGQMHPTYAFSRRRQLMRSNPTVGWVNLVCPKDILRPSVESGPPCKRMGS